MEHSKVSLPGIGLFGAGMVVKVLVPLLRSKGFKIEAIWARTPESAKEAAMELDIPFHTSKEDEVLLRKSVSLVVILCEPHLHSMIAVKALGIGKHVLCDRPAGLNESDVLKMVRAAQYYPSLISIICHALRFLPAIVHMKRHVNDGYVGQVQIVEARVYCGKLFNEQFGWMHEAHTAGGALANFGSHLIDIITYVTGLRAVRVLGTLKTLETVTDHFHQTSADDYCTFQMELENGAAVTVNINTRFAGQYSEELVICGSEGNIIARSGDLYGQKMGSLKEEVLYLDVEDLKQSPSILPRNLNDLAKDKLADKINPPSLPKAHIKGLVKLISALKDAFVSISHGQIWHKEHVQNAANFEDGLYIQSVVDAIRKSSQYKVWTRVNLEHNDLIEAMYKDSPNEDNSNNLYANLYRGNGLSL